MNTTEATKWINTARPLITFIEDQGGPKMYDWCWVPEMCIFGYQGESASYVGGLTDPSHKAITCPPAVVAAICMWANDGVFAWFGIFHSDKTEHAFHGLTNDSTPGGHQRVTLALLAAMCRELGYKEESDD